MRVSQWFEELRDDVKFAFRQLRAAPVFTAIAVTTLALGIGANSAIFALVDATLLRPLPYANPDRLVTIWETTDANPRSFASPPNMLDWNTRSRTFEKIAGFMPNVGGMVMAGRDGNAETVSRQWVTAGIFDVLGVKPIAGRTFFPEDEEKRLNVIVISESFWESRFNRDPAIVGQEIKMDGILWTVVGIVPKTFEILGRTSVWAMRPLVNMPPRVRGQYMLQVVGRMKPDAGIGAAQSDLSAVAAGLAREFPQTNVGRGVRLEPMHDTMIGSDLKVTSMLFLGVVGFVLLICCANVANLLMARASARTRELAVRAALGAGRRRIIRQLLTESLVLSLIGGGLGLAIGAAILDAAPALIPQGLLPGTVTLAFDLRVVGVLRRGGPHYRRAVRPRPGLAGDDNLHRGGDGRGHADHDGRRRAAAQPAGRRRGRHGGAAPVRCGAAAADADGRRIVRSRVSRRERAHDARRSAGVELPDAREAAAVLRSGRSGSADGSRGAGRRRGRARCRSVTRSTAISR